MNADNHNSGRYDDGSVNAFAEYIAESCFYLDLACNEAAKAAANNPDWIAKVCAAHQDLTPEFVKSILQLGSERKQTRSPFQLLAVGELLKSAFKSDQR